jgi:serine/alanine adding enzyme
MAKRNCQQDIHHTGVCNSSECAPPSAVSDCLVEVAAGPDEKAWDTYVLNHPEATPYHLYGWRRIIADTYGHKTWYLIARINSGQNTLPGSSPKDWQCGQIVGVLPLVHIKHFVFGNKLISMPFVDCGGIVAKAREVERALLSEAIRLGREQGVSSLELRHVQPIDCLDGIDLPGKEGRPISVATKSHRSRLLLALPKTRDQLWESFKSKLKSQIKKPLNEGLISRVGGIELLNDFYKIFLINMRDLGSPVHSRDLMRNVLEEFPDRARIFVVYKGKTAVAASLVVGFRGVLGNPWASSLRKYARLSPNMLLYFRMLEYACEQGFSHFDFGRSSPGEGTFKFKEQWGARPVNLHWHYISLNNQPVDEHDKSKFEKAIYYWQKLPVCLTAIMGPRVRKYIAL